MSAKCFASRMKQASWQQDEKRIQTRTYSMKMHEQQKEGALGQWILSQKGPRTTQKGLKFSTNYACHIALAQGQ